MMQPSNTPPDGDFVRYLDRLTAAQAVARSTAPAARVTAAMPGLPLMNTGQQPEAHIPFLHHVKWAVGLLVATQILARFVPGAGYSFISLLAFYVIWVIYRQKPQPPGAFLMGLAMRASRAAEEARKPSSTFPKNKP